MYIYMVNNSPGYDLNTGADPRMCELVYFHFMKYRYEIKIQKHKTFIYYCYNQGKNLFKQLALITVVYSKPLLVSLQFVLHCETLLLYTQHR